MTKKLKILVCPANEGGCSYYRVLAPYKKMLELYPDQIELRFNLNPLGIVEEGEKVGTWKENWKFEDMKWADVIVTNNISNWGGPYTARIIGKGKEFKKFVAYDNDDLLTDLYVGHRLYDTYKEKNLSEITKFIYNNSDLVTVTQRKFAERVKPFCGGVLAIVKNAIDYTLPCWNNKKVKSPRKKLVRIGWAGGIHHEEDLKEFIGVPNSVNGRVGRENVSWGFFGSPRLPIGGKKEDWQHEVWKKYRAMLTSGFKGSPNWTIYNALPPDNYGAIFSTIDLAIAPLQMNEFNDSKSEIKVAEAGRYKIPLIASDVGCYDETIVNGKTGYLIPAGAPRSEWVRVLTKCIKNPKHIKEMGENLHKLTEEYFDLNKVVKHRMELLSKSISMISNRETEDKSYNKEWKFNE